MCATANDLQPDVILITETWCSDETSEAFLTVPGYDLQQDLRQDRRDTAGGRGGGLLVYAKPGVRILAIDKVVDFNQYAKFLLNDITVYLIYRPPSGGLTSIAGLTELVRRTEKSSIMVGDFNLPEINWSSGQTGARSREFMGAAEEKFLEQLVDFGTHIKGNTLDLVLTNIPERVLNVEECGRLGHSDHSMIMVTVAVSSGGGTKEKEQLNWAKGDWVSMRNELLAVNWRNELNGKDGNAAWSVLKEKILKTVEKFVPKRRRRNFNKPAWLSSEILRAIRRKKRLWRKAKDGDRRDKDEYDKEEKRVRRMIRSAKRRFEKKLADGGKKDGVAKRRFYAYVKSRTKTRPSIGPLKDKDGRLMRENLEMATLFNESFVKMFTREDTANVPEPTEKFEGHILEDVVITKKMVQDKIKKLRRGAAAGPDGIGPQILQELSVAIASPLATVMRRTMDTGKVPDDWRTANVSPIYKKGSKSCANNYRPVSLTSVCCKMLESILKDAVVSHLDRHKLIRPSQHGFMKGRSCTSNLLCFMEKITAAVDGGEAVDVVFLDFAKAFDKVPIQRLLKKVKAHGIGGKLYSWIAAWLTDRLQRVVLSGEASSWAAVLSGVPQGSVLGPLLFLLFINDLDKDAECVEILLKFADDTKVAQPVRNEEDKRRLQAALDGLVGWAERWGMEFNVQKCKVMHIGRNNQRHKYSMGGMELGTTEEEKDLGVLMSNKLKPASQCAKAARTAQTVLGQIARAFHFKDRYVFVQLYKTYVRPHLEFAVQAWSPWTAADREVLEKVQRRAVGMISGLRATGYEDRLLELDMTTLEERRHQSDMAMVFKILTGKEDIDPALLFSMAGTAGRPTRSAADPLNVRIQHGRLECRKHFFSVRVTEQWNNVPTDIKNSRTIGSFKNAYAKHRKDNI